MNIPVEFVSELNSPDHSVVVAKPVGDGDDPSPAAVSHSAPQSLYSSATVDRGVHRLKFNCHCTGCSVSSQTLVGLALTLVVHVSALFCLGRWSFGRNG